MSTPARLHRDSWSNLGSLCLWLIGVWALSVPLDASADRVRDEIRVSGMTFVSSEHTGRQWVVRAEQARFEAGGEIAHLDGVTIRFRDESEQVDLTIRCAAARFVVGSESFRLEGSVDGLDAGGRRFVTDWLEFDGAQRVLSTTAPVEITDAGAEYRGGGMRYDVATRRLHLSPGASMRRRGKP